MLKTLEKAKRAVRIIFWAVLFVVLLAGIIAGWDTVSRWLVVIVGGLVALLGGRKALDQRHVNEKTQEVREKEKELDQAADDRQKQAEILAREDEKQQEAIEDWRERKNRWKSRIGLMLILCMLLVVARPAWAGVEDRFEGLSREELIEIIIEAEKLLDEADQLLARETSLKEEYKRLYLEAEADLRAARELSGQKDEIIAGQNREIELLRYRLERSNQAWGITAGIDLGDSARWRVGVARKKGWLSFGAGIGGGDRFSVWGEVGLWVR
jgi:hypothetical protein